MEEIVSYKLEDDGTYTAVIKGLEIGKDETLMIDNGFTVQADVKVSICHYSKAEKESVCFSE